MALKIILLSDEHLRLEDAAGPLTIEAESAEMVYSPFHMVASGLATCVFALLQSWAQHAGVSAERLAVEVRWAFAEKPHRVGSYDVRIQWPGLPEGRREAAARASSLCAVHRTLEQPPAIEVEVLQ